MARFLHNLRNFNLDSGKVLEVVFNKNKKLQNMFLGRKRGNFGGSQLKRNENIKILMARFMHNLRNCNLDSGKVLEVVFKKKKKLHNMFLGRERGNFCRSQL